MKNDLSNMLLLAMLFLLLFALSEILYHRFKIRVEFTRKLVHIGTGIISLLFPILLASHWSVLFLCGVFAVIVVLSLKFNLLQSIHAIDRKSAGSLAYPAAVYLCFVTQTYLDDRNIFYYLPLATLAICDPMAALSGKKWPLGPYMVLGAKKTVLGSIAFFISAIVLTFFIWKYAHDSSLDFQELTIITTIALMATFAEALSKDGYDNLTIPLSTIVSLYILLP
ncbi:MULTISPECIES: diacylglycerol/polyprenol kinase family protein [Sphingobacterium]|uniref:diacylglycerol/polyprenol kinase family protein n=1 Tax=Sphingobacterium TaxID=28453 RepID=UPI00257C0CC3|nr:MULTISPECIES: phosphatidate cytidylyltransferase [Sphingobacterium]